MNYCTTGKPSVLFVDDEINLIYTIPPILSLHGFEVKAVTTVEDALAAIEDAEFDILLTDLNISGPNDGHLIVNAMREAQRGAKTAIITGYAHSLHDAAHPSAPDRYFTKPMPPDKLVAALWDMVRSS